MNGLKVFFLLLCMAVVMTFSSCTSDDVQSECEVLIFGRFYGECIGDECSVTYKLTETSLWVDQDHSYRGSNPEFSELSNADFEKAKGLMTLFPDELLSISDGTIGCPDCYDQGGQRIDYEVNGVNRAWFLDHNKSEVPEPLHSFMDSVESTINQLLE